MILGRENIPVMRRRAAACLLLCCWLVSLPSHAFSMLPGAFLSAGLTEALNRLGTLVDAPGASTGSGGSGSLGAGLNSLDPQQALPPTWFLTLESTNTGDNSPPVLLSNDAFPKPSVQVSAATAGGEPTRLVLSWKAENVDPAALLRLEIGSGDDTQPLAVGAYAASAAATPGTPLLAVQYAVDACRAADRGFTVEGIAFQGDTLVELDLRFHCGEELHGVVHYRDIGRLDADAVVVSGHVWEDQGMDGLRDGSGDDPDRPVFGVAVELMLDGRAVSRVQTDDSGAFRFYADYHSYQVRVSAPTGMTLTARDAGGDEARDSDFDPTTGLSDPLVPPQPTETFFGGRRANTAPLTVGLGYPDGHPSLPLPSARFTRLLPGERSTYSAREAGKTRYNTDTIEPGGLRLNGSVTRVVRDSDGNRLWLSNDARGLRLHQAKVTLTNGRAYDYRFAPPLVLLPPQVALGPHASNGRVTVSRTGAKATTLKYDFDARFSAGHGGLAASLTPMATPRGAGLGLFSQISLGFVGARGATPLSAGVDAEETWSLDQGLRSSTLLGGGSPRSHWATALRANVTDSNDGNRTSDVLGVHTQSGAFGWWRMRGLAAPQWRLQGGSAEKQRLVQGDVDGDGRPEIIRHDEASGLVSIEHGDGARTPLAFAAPGSRLLGVIASNRDVQARLLWRDVTTSRLTLWQVEDRHRLALTPIASAAPATWTLHGSGDFDGNGSDDLVWRDTANARYVLWFMNDAVREGVAVKRLPTTWRLAAVDDFDGDGRADLFWHEPRSRATRLWLMRGATVLVDRPLRKADVNATVVDSGDYDGNGAADLLWRRSATGSLTTWLLRGTQVRGIATLGRLPGGFVPQQ